MSLCQRSGAARRALPSAVVLAAAALLTGCGEEGPQGADRTSSPSPTGRVETYDAQHTRIEASPGERFAVALKANPSTGYVWVVDDPGPDAGVVSATGERMEGIDKELVGSGGTKYLDFRAKAPGRTRIELRHCYRCGTPEETIDEYHEVTELTFEVTVRK